MIINVVAPLKKKKKWNKVIHVTNVYTAAPHYAHTHSPVSLSET